MKIFSILQRKCHVAGSLSRECLSILVSKGPVQAAHYTANVARGVYNERLGRKKPKTNRVDSEFGTDTAENVKLDTLDIRSPNSKYAVYYRATDLPILEELLASLNINHPEYTFIDFGSGKGLVLLQAAALPFKKVIGVEFARELHEIACRNAREYPAHLLKAPIEPVHADALEFSFPDGKLVLYFYQPFEVPLTQKMVERIGDCLAHRDFLVACVWSDSTRNVTRPLWHSQTFLEPVAAGEHWTVFRSKVAQPQVAAASSGTG